MQEPKSGVECDFDMCPLQDDYVTSDEEINSARRKSLMRCSMCKNRFYCSTKCQRSDWKEHKWNCSVLPVNRLPAATVVEIDDEFKAEVKRVVAILKDVAAALKDDKKKLSVPMLAPLLSTLCHFDFYSTGVVFHLCISSSLISHSIMNSEIPSELPDRLRYTRPIQDSDSFKYRLPIVTACRLLLIDYVSTLDDARRDEYEKFFAGMRLPPSWCEMYGPKIVGRPADLSPGEYAMLAEVMPVWVMPEIEKAKAEKKNLQVSVGEETAADENAGEESENPEGMQWVWLAVMLKRVYSAKSG
ncbi:hypothetical protein GGX14DRAFT_661037 [Mycena pura]|uniref:MYND-type domain-containing protein n=1 Tax=Mycena pura TaxID=153505 RepID=A0AAD6V1W4_9AGAR|nr:hypothetical protein GGX14DRAFT_661037 [Mycena pura]